jgi:hypothetical protein
MPSEWTILYREHLLKDMCKQPAPEPRALTFSASRFDPDDTAQVVTNYGYEVVFKFPGCKEAAYLAYWLANTPMITAEQFYKMVGGEDVARSLKAAVDRCGGLSEWNRTMNS